MHDLCQQEWDHSMPADHPEANRIVERWHRSLKTAITSMCSNSQDWFQRLPLILLGLRFRPHLDSGLSPHHLAFGTDVTLSADFPSREPEELDGTEFYKNFQCTRDSYIYPQAVHHQQDIGCPCLRLTGGLSRTKREDQVLMFWKEGTHPQTGSWLIAIKTVISSRRWRDRWPLASAETWRGQPARVPDLPPSMAPTPVDHGH